MKLTINDKAVETFINYKMDCDPVIYIPVDFNSELDSLNEEELFIFNESLLYGLEHTAQVEQFLEFERLETDLKVQLIATELERNQYKLYLEG